MGQRRAGHQHRCRVCRINTFFCVCSHIKPLKIETTVSLVVHVRELKLTSNTAQFAEKMLPQEGKIFIRGGMNKSFDAQAILERPGRALFLYPHEDALELNPDFREKFPGPYHLIVPDGNWHQARKVRQREKGFSDLMSVKLPLGLKSEYGLRKAPHPEWLSTYEAVAHALGILESPTIREEMMIFFRLWSQRTKKARSGDFALDPEQS